VFRTLRAERHSLPAAGAPSLEAVPLPFVHEVDGQQVLRIPSFGVADTTLFADRVSELFAALDPARPLIIDVRGNEGGLRTNAIPILNRLLPARYTQWTRITARVRRVPDEHRPFVSFPLGGEERLRQFGEGATARQPPRHARRWGPLPSGRRTRRRHPRAERFPDCRAMRQPYSPRPALKARCTTGLATSRSGRASRSVLPS